MEKHKQLDHEIRDMIAALTKRLAELQHIHKSASSASSHGHAHGDDSSHHQHRIGNHDDDSSHHQHRIGHHDDDHRGLRIITLAGSNQGATMHGELMDDKANTDDDDPYEALGTYVNSNFQAINNSIMMEGSYTTNDPGVHMDISDVIDHQHGLHPGQKHGEGEKIGKKKKKDKENGKSKQQHSDNSD
ncbi:hypothetical protein QQ045_018167 [Rhodiola kirilowii]